MGFLEVRRGQLQYHRHDNLVQLLVFLVVFAKTWLEGLVFLLETIQFSLSAKNSNVDHISALFCST